MNSDIVKPEKSGHLLLVYHFRVPLKELWNYNLKFFCVHHTIGKNNLHIALNLHFVTPNQISTYRKLNLILINCVYLFFFTLKMQRRLVQTKVQFLLCLKRNNWQNSSCEKPLLQFVGYWYNLLHWMFFILCDSWKALFFLKVCCYNGFFLTVMLLLSLKKLFKKIPGF